MPVKQATVKVYPIACQLVGSTGTYSVNIMKMTQNGLLIDSLNQPLSVHSNFKAVIPLPFKAPTIEVDVTVFKTHDQFRGKHGTDQAGHHVSELVFKIMPPATRSIIQKFLIHIGSVKF